jgi:hypothetical protein
MAVMLGCTATDGAKWMPAKPSYCHRLPQAIEKLNEITSSWIGRSDLEEIIGVSKTVAWRILRQCDAEEGPGGALFCDRRQLIERLERLLSEGSGTVAREVARRQRLEEKLLAVRSFMKASATKIVRDEHALALLSTRFRTLPPNVTLTSKSLHIEFCGTEDFLAAVGAVVYALQNDYKKIADFIEMEPAARS